MNRFFPLILLYLTWVLTSEARLPLPPMAATHLVTFFVLATVCHGALAEDRPATSRLTDFYLSLAIGGALGGVFNTLVAPLLFEPGTKFVANAVPITTNMPTQSRLE